MPFPEPGGLLPDITVGSLWTLRPDTKPNWPPEVTITCHSPASGWVKAVGFLRGSDTFVNLDLAVFLDLYEPRHPTLWDHILDDE